MMTALTVIYGLSAEFKPNCISVITGNSGSGKTTLIKILSGLLPIKSGNIRIDDVDFNELNLERWRSQISSISQNPYFIQGSVRDNLKFGFLPDAQYLEKIIDICHIRDVEKRFYGKNVGEGGKALSSGEKQRISFARALLQNRPVFILDEPLSQVDIPTANKILENVLPILQQKTCILVTHNPLWMDVATHIYTMFDGKLFEGRHC